MERGVGRCHEPQSPWCGSRPSLACEFEAVAAGNTERLNALRDSHAYICPDEGLLEDLTLMSPLVELGAGRGYWARLLRDLGAEIVAFDNGSWAVTGDAWTEVQPGDEKSLVAFRDRTLLMVKPPRRGSGKMVRAWPGRRMVVVTDGSYPNPKMLGGGEQDAMSAIADGGWQFDRSHALSDPFIPWFVGAYFFSR